MKIYTDVVITLRDRQIEASIDELKARDELTMALRQALNYGADINDLSDASGLTTDAIRTRVDSDLAMGEDLAGLAGLK